MEVSYRKYDLQTKKASTLTKTIVGTPIDPSFKVGQSVTAIGYVFGPQNFQLADAKALTHESAVYDVGRLSIVSGYLVEARMNDEKDQDGNHKLKGDGSPKKPHFDLILKVMEDGKEVNHFIKNYNFLSKDQSLVDNITPMRKKFEKFESPETTPTYVTIVTQPGQSFQFEKGDGSVYYGVSHMGTRSVDQIFEYQLQKENEQPQQTTVQAPVTQPAPQVQTPPPVPTELPFQTPEPRNTVTPVEQEVNGIDDDFELDLDSSFT